jgi:hypothetical protein
MATRDTTTRSSTNQSDTSDTQRVSTSFAAQPDYDAGDGSFGKWTVAAATCGVGRTRADLPVDSNIAYSASQ